jgi:hypothetical protein
MTQEMSLQYGNRRCADDDDSLGLHTSLGRNRCRQEKKTENGKHYALMQRPNQETRHEFARSAMLMSV